MAENMLTTTLRHCRCQLCISKPYKKYHNAADCKTDCRSNHTTGSNPVPGRYHPAPSNHCPKSNHKDIPCTKHFVKFRFLCLHILHLFSVLLYLSKSQVNHLQNIFCSLFQSKHTAVNQHMAQLPLPAVLICHIPVPGMKHIIIIFHQFCGFFF